MPEANELEIANLNVDDLDVTELEQRLELASASVDDCWGYCFTCPNLDHCGVYDGACTKLTDCTSFDACTPET